MNKTIKSLKNFNLKEYYMATAGLIVLIALVLVWFTQTSDQTLLNTSKTFAEENAVQTNIRLENQLSEYRSFIEMSAVSLTYTMDSSDDISKEVLENLNRLDSSGIVERVTVVDGSGRYYTADGEELDIRDQEIYIKGMAGKSGFTTVQTNQAGGEILLGYYAPIFDGKLTSNETKAVLVGFITQEHLSDMLESQVAGYDAPTFLCKEDGTIVGSDRRYKLQGLNIFEEAPKYIDFVGDGAEQAMKAAFEKEELAVYFYEGKSGKACGSINPLKSIDLVVCQIIDSAAISTLVGDNEKVNSLMIHLMVVIFMLYIIQIYFITIRRTEKMHKASKKASYVVDGIERLYECFILVDFTDDTYELLRGNHELFRRIPDKGKAMELAGAINSLIYDSEERRTIEAKLNKEALTERLKENKEDKSSYRFMKDGRICWENLNYLLVESDSEGNPSKALLSIEDATEYKKTEEESLHRVQIIQTLLKNYSSAFEVNLEQGTVRLLSAERNIVRYMGREILNVTNFDEIRHLYAEQYIDDDYREGFIEITDPDHIRETLLKQEYFTYTYMEKQHRDRQHYYQLKMVRMKNDVSSVVAGVANVNEEMQTQIRQRAMLMNALSEAEHASIAKSKFLSNMSHDIRTPMNAIIGFTTLAQSHIDNQEKTADYLEKIMSSSQHLLALINDVLDMSRIESGKIQIEEKLCNLSEMLDEMAILFQDQATEKNINFVVNRTGLIDEMVYCDKLRINQILMNLVSNAVKFTPVGGTVTLKARQRSDGPRGVGGYEFSVKDNGIGMSEEFVKTIWEPFERERNSTVSGITGTGLGTAITKNLVDLMGGQINVVSEKGVGTEFTVYLMLRQQDTEVIKNTLPAAGPARGLEGESAENEDVLALAAQEKVAEEGVKVYADLVSGAESRELVKTKELSPAERIETAKKFTEGKHILLVEDNELNREIGGEILGDLGIIVDFAENGQIAVEKIQSQPAEAYDLVFMDVQMPVMNGYEATRAIRAMEDMDKADIPIIAMTANAFEEDIQAAISAGMDGHIAKPVSIDKIFDTLKGFWADIDTGQF